MTALLFMRRIFVLRAAYQAPTPHPRYPSLGSPEPVAYCQLGSQLTRSGLQGGAEAAGGARPASVSSGNSLKENIKDILKSSGVFALPQVGLFLAIFYRTMVLLKGSSHQIEMAESCVGAVKSRKFLLERSRSKVLAPAPGQTEKSHILVLNFYLQ
jgi:hypothetical protein